MRGAGRGCSDPVPFQRQGDNVASQRGRADGLANGPNGGGPGMNRKYVTMTDPAALQAAEEMTQVWGFEGKTFPRGLQDLLIREADSQKGRLARLRKADSIGSKETP